MLDCYYPELTGSMLGLEKYDYKEKVKIGQHRILSPQLLSECRIWRASLWSLINGPLETTDALTRFCQFPACLSTGHIENPIRVIISSVCVVGSLWSRYEILNVPWKPHITQTPAEKR